MSDYREFQDGEVVPGTRYRVARLIGVGGMGRVYEVEHVELGKRFVLKALQPELVRREDLVARLRNEWRALARLEHPNIVGVTDAGNSANDIPFYVMERLDGEILSSLLHRQRRLIPPQALSIASGILDGLHAAHQIGVVHRDVKPPNIFLTSAGVVKVLDFGIAKIQDASGVITARGIAVGTPRYMSPEQAQGATVDARSDIYAVGLILFEMVAGVGPFDDAKDNNELILAQLGRAAPLLSSVSVVAPELDALVASMLAKDPRERPPNAGQVAETLRALAVRYARYVDADAPTVTASRPATPEPPTRVDGPRRSLQAASPTRPDAPAALARPLGGDTTTAQPALELATTATHVLPQGPASVQRSTLRLSEPLPTPSLFGADTQVDPLTQIPGGDDTSERTELLLTAALPVAQRGAGPAAGLGAGAPLEDGDPTRTAVPLVAPPASKRQSGRVSLTEGPQLTPPPVVPATGGGSAPPADRPSARTVRLVALLGVSLLLGGGALWLRRPTPVATSAHAQAAESPQALSVESAPPIQPLQSAVPQPAPADARGLPASAPAPDVPGATPGLARTAAPTSKPTTPPVAAPKKAVPFPEAAQPSPAEPLATPGSPRPTPAKPKVSPAMPGSGL